METAAKSHQNIQEIIPFLSVADMEESLKFYIDGLGFMITHKSTPKEKIEWCCIRREGAALMLQISGKNAGPVLADGKKGTGVSIFFICKDALLLYQEFISRNIPASEPFVGNNMWVVSLRDPDGYSIEFESITDVPEGTQYSGWHQ